MADLDRTPGPYDRQTARRAEGILAEANAAQVLGVADVHVAEERRSAVFDALLQVAWSNDTAHNHERLTHLLQSHASDAATDPACDEEAGHAPVHEP